MKKALWLMMIVFLGIVGVLLIQQEKRKEAHTKEAIEKKIVVATIYPIYFVTKTIAGDAIEVKRLIKPGNEVHTFSPTPADMVELEHADLLITLGDELEPWVTKLNHSIKIDTLALSDGLYLLASSKTEHLHDAHHDHSINPHVWLDFANEIKMIDTIQERLTKLYPQHKELFTTNGSKLKEQFSQLDDSYKKKLQGCKQDTILVGHDAFGYMQKRYHFDAHSIMGIFAHSRPNASKIAQLTESIKSKNFKYLLIDPIESSKSALQLAHDNNLTLLPLYTLGNIPLDEEKQGEDMITLLHQNLKTLAQGLECL